MTINQITLSKKKDNWVKNRSTTLRGTKLVHNAAISEKYKKKLEYLVDAMIKETNKEILKLFKNEDNQEYFKKQKQDLKIVSRETIDESISSQARILTNKLLKKFSDLFAYKSKSLSEYMLNASLKYSKSTVHASLQKLTGGLSLKTGVVSKGLEEVSKAIVAENVSLIKSIPELYFTQITGAVMRSITTGNGLADLRPYIEKYEGMTKRKAKNIALDQTRKAYNLINKQKLVDLGVKQFIWIHTAGSINPRESHQDIDGHTFSFDNLEAEQIALNVPKQDRGLPSIPPYCRCTMNPVIQFGN